MEIVFDSWKVNLKSKFNGDNYQNGFLDDLCKFMAKNSSIYHDVELKCADGSVFSQRLLLACRSHYFKALFEFDNEKKVVDLTQFKKSLVKAVVDSLIHLDENIFESLDIVKVLEISNYLQIPALMEFASVKVTDQLNFENVVDIFKTAQASNNEDLVFACQLYMGKNFVELVSTSNIFLIDCPVMIKKIIEQRLNIQHHFTLKDAIAFVEAVFKVMSKLDLMNEFEDLVTNKFDKKLLYFALTHDKSSLDLYANGKNYQFVPDIDKTSKICPKSELGLVLKKLCPRPNEGILLFGEWAKRWTDKYGDLSATSYDLGPEWKIEGEIKKIKFHYVAHQQDFYISGLEISLKDKTLKKVGYVDSPETGEFVGSKGNEIRTLGICYSNETKLIRAIQVNHGAQAGKSCTWDLFHADGGAPNNMEHQERLHFMWSMGEFGPNRDQDDHLKRLEHCFVRGLSGKTVVLNGIPFICELQVKYCVKLEAPQYPEDEVMNEVFDELNQLDAAQYEAYMEYMQHNEF